MVGLLRKGAEFSGVGQSLLLVEAFSFFFKFTQVFLGAILMDVGHGC